jgi:hypothetical protein
MFKKEDFLDLVDAWASKLVAERANALWTKTEVYGLTPDQIFFLKENWLANNTEIPKFCFQHEPMPATEDGAYYPETFCKKCNKKLKAEWREA